MWLYQRTASSRTNYVVSERTWLAVSTKWSYRTYRKLNTAHVGLILSRWHYLGVPGRKYVYNPHIHITRPENILPCISSHDWRNSSAGCIKQNLHSACKHSWARWTVPTRTTQCSFSDINALFHKYRMFQKMGCVTFQSICMCVRAYTYVYLQSNTSLHM